MQLKANPLDIEAGGPLIVVMNIEDAADLGVISSDRIYVRHGREYAICIMNISTEDERGYLGVYREVRDRLGVEENSIVLVEPARAQQATGNVSQHNCRCGNHCRQGPRTKHKRINPMGDFLFRRGE